MSTRITYEFTSRSLRDIVNDTNIQIPEHQRPEIWNQKLQTQLIDTIMSGRPMPNITFREEINQGTRTLWLEDGQQRYISIKKFIDNRLQWNNRWYRDFTTDEQIHILTYRIGMLLYSNATYEETIAIFDTFQNGKPLSPGQRFHARRETPLVRYARERLLSSHQHFYDRASAVWGPHTFNSDTKTKRVLMNAMAIVGGIVRGVESITTSYDILGPHLSEEFDVAAADQLLDQLLRVYESANARQPSATSHKKHYWPVGNVTGYILATFLEFPSIIPDLSNKWSHFLVAARRGERNIDELLEGVPASRSWNSTRWRIGYLNIFPELAPDEVQPHGEQASTGNESDSDSL